MLTREQFLGSFVRRYRTVETIAGQLRIRNLTEGEKSDFESGSLTAEGKLNLTHVRSQRRRLAEMVLVDQEGGLLLQAGDAQRMKDVDAAVVNAIFTAATEHCGFSTEELRELEKNYVEAAAADSPTG